MRRTGSSSSRDKAATSVSTKATARCHGSAIGCNSLRIKLLAMVIIGLFEKAGLASAAAATVVGATETLPQLHVVWEDVTFEVDTSNRKKRTRTGAGSGRKHILRNVSGEALPGRVLAIMGPSGSGKSSLLNVLAGRVPESRLNRLVGSVEIGGETLGNFDMTRYTAYVRQQQDFYPFLSVRETLLIAAGLRLERSVSQADREEIVSEVMEKLGISRVADTLVGDLRTPGISGGEKRRLAMGLQLIGLETPSVLFLDEPTSGLDSHQALQVMETIRDLCTDGHTVLVSIHQPRSSIYALFDDLLLLSEGMVMYHGPKDDALSQLASLGHRCPSNFNPADFMVDLISPVTHVNGANGQKETAAKAQALDDMAQLAREVWTGKSAARARKQHDQRKKEQWSTSWWRAGTPDEEQRAGKGRREDSGETLAEKNNIAVNGGTSRRTTRRREKREGMLALVPASASQLEVCKEPGRRKSRWHTQFGLLLKRSWRQATRDTFATVARIAMGFGLGGVFGSIFWKLPLKESSIQNRVSLFVNVAVNTAMFGCIRALQTLAVERPVVALERMDQGYSASAYVASKILAESPVDAVFPLIFGSTVYFAAGLNRPIGGPVKLLKFLGTLLIQAHASSALGLMIGCLSPSIEVANLAGPAMIIVFLMLGGVHDDIPPFLKKMENLSTMKWGIQGIVTNEMRGIKFAPDGKKLLMGWTLGTDKEVIPGEDVMEKMGFKGEDLRKPTRRLLSLAAAFHSITLINLFISEPRFQRLESLSPPPPEKRKATRRGQDSAVVDYDPDGDVF